MKVTKDFWVDEGRGTEVFQLTVEVEGKLYAIETRRSAHSQLPLDYIVRDQRRQIMAAIEKELFKGVR